MKELKQKFKLFCERPFPGNVSTNEVVSDLFMELVEYDSYIAGLIDQAVNGKKVDPIKLLYNQNLEDKLYKCIKEEDLDDVSSKAVLNYIDYLFIIKNLLEDLK